MIILLFDLALLHNYKLNKQNVKAVLSELSEISSWIDKNKEVFVHRLIKLCKIKQKMLSLAIENFIVYY